MQGFVVSTTHRLEYERNGDRFFMRMGPIILVSRRSNCGCRIRLALQFPIAEVSEYGSLTALLIEKRGERWRGSLS